MLHLHGHINFVNIELCNKSLKMESINITL